jgi:hypothetical protein
MATRLEHSHDINIDNGVYADELSSIDVQMEKIKESYGLKPDEYWKIKDAPPEYRKLSRKYEKVINNRLTELFEQHNLVDIAELRRRSLPAMTKVGRGDEEPHSINKIMRMR